MTTPHFSTLPAGRELDALVAQAAGRYPVQWETGTPFVPLDAENHSPSRCDNWVEVPPFSTDVAAAWKVVEWFAQQRYYVSIELDADRVWWVRFGAPEPVSAPTAPLAICRAALLALEPR